jgi:hypothetical protein
LIATPHEVLCAVFIHLRVVEILSRGARTF